jgi:Methyltransferase domain
MKDEVDRGEEWRYGRGEVAVRVGDQPDPHPQSLARTSSLEPVPYASAVDTTPFPDGFFARRDESDDDQFYTFPRKVTHIDDGAIDACRELYRELLPVGGRILDLMSSWRSHLPDDVKYASVVGLGMNAEEMIDNPQLSEHVVHDLNSQQKLPFPDAAFDGAVCTVSVQYLTHPVQTFREIARVLTAGSPFIVTYSNRCFPEKAVAGWLSLGDEDHGRLVALYFQRSGSWTKVTTDQRRRGTYGAADPLYAVWAYRS